MKLRLLFAGALAVAGASSFATAPASAWECPKPVTQAYYVDNPVTGGQTRICTPYLNCETCLGVMP